MYEKKLVEVVTEIVLKELNKQEQPGNGKDRSDLIPVGISNRHVHLSNEHLKILFGENIKLNKLKDLSQPGQYACHETVTLVGPKGVIERVRLLGPPRDKTQVELALSDCYKLGVRAPVRDSGDLECSAGITIVGPAGAITLNEGCIIAARHIHMHTDDAKKFKVKDKDKVNVKVTGSRGVIFLNVLVRVGDKYSLEMHVDIDEANAAGLKNGDLVEIVNPCEGCLNF